MKQCRRIIFAAETGTCRAPMAMGLLIAQKLDFPVEIQARGLVVLFPEPLNQKAEAVMAGKGIRLENFKSTPLRDEDFSDDTLVLVFGEDHRKKILEEYPRAKNVHVLTELTGDELEIMDPYGGDLATYGLCLESMVKPIRTLAKMLNQAFRTGQQAAD